MPRRPRVSLIVVSYNSAALLPAFLETALATVLPGDEILVVDNASTDASCAIAEHYGGSVRLIRAPENLGFGRACNLGADHAGGELFVFLNPDITFPAGWLEPLIAAAWSDPGIGLLCPQPLPPGSTMVEYANRPAIEDRAMLPGCCLAVRREIWLRLGGFDEAFFLYWEDTELCWRTWLLGWRVVVVHTSYVYHIKGATTRAFGRWDAERTRNSLYTYLKLMPWPAILSFAVRLAMATCAKALLRPSLAPELARAWAWNLSHLSSILQARRSIQQRRHGSYHALERLIRAQRQSGHG